MKTLHDIEKNLEEFESLFGMKCIGAQQGSGTWLNMKLGVVSASNAHRAMAKKDTQKRASYICELVSHILTGTQKEINSQYIEFGTQFEGAARTAYEMKTGSKITPVSFIFKDNKFRCGCSPDGVIEKDGFGLELKVPYNPENYVEFFSSDKVDSEYLWQVQFSMWCTGASKWDFAMYAPLAKVKPLKATAVLRDEEKMKALDDLIPQFIEDYDSVLKKFGLEYGVQWKRLAES